MNVPESSYPVKNHDHPVCALCSSRVGPLERLADGTIVCLTQAYCRRRRTGVWPREEPYDSSAIDRFANVLPPGREEAAP